MGANNAESIALTRALTNISRPKENLQSTLWIVLKRTLKRAHNRAIFPPTHGANLKEQIDNRIARRSESSATIEGGGSVGHRLDKRVHNFSFWMHFTLLMVK
jgi:hypothetical protein